MKNHRVFTFDNIINAAVELIRTSGWQNLTTRKIAAQMGSSTMPIYSHVKSLEDLEVPLRESVKKILQDYQQRPYTEEPLLNIAFGYVVFARDEQNLFRFLHHEKPERIADGDLSGMRESFHKQFGTDTPAGAAFSSMDTKAQDMVLQSTWIFTHGLASLINAGTLGECPDERIFTWLKDSGEAFFMQGIRKNRT